VHSSLRSRASFLLALLLALSAFVAEGRAAAPVLPRSYPAAGQLVVPTVTVRTAPTARAKKLAVLRDFRRTDFKPQIVLALELRAEKNGRLWFKISLPGRPNGRVGWIPASSASLKPTAASIVVHRGARTLELQRAGKVLLRTRVAVGKRGAETPLGHFYVTSRFTPRNSFLGSYALETSAYSKLSEWPGGGVVGIHGTSRRDLLGQAVSHGCIRVSNAAALELKRLAPAGTPIAILR
jgi:lipoprotein-anchoring transpeptidase ErfK/SrfK